MTESQRSTANFGVSPIQPGQFPSLLERPPLPPAQNRDSNGEVFVFSFNENIKPDRFKSREPSPSPASDSRKDSPILEELSLLQSRMKEINSRLEHNLEVLKVKQKKNESLKKLIQITEAKSTNHTDISVVEGGCACKKICSLL